MRCASSSIADSSAKVPIDSPGARIQVLATVSRWTIFWPTNRFSVRRDDARGTCTARRSVACVVRHGRAGLDERGELAVAFAPRATRCSAGPSADDAETCPRATARACTGRFIAWPPPHRAPCCSTGDLAAEAAADERRDHAERRPASGRRLRAWLVLRPFTNCVVSKTRGCCRRPQRDGRVRLDGVVVVTRRAVDDCRPNRRLRQRPFGVAYPDLGLLRRGCRTGLPRRPSVRRRRRAGSSVSYSTRTSVAAYSACSSVSATTTATGWPFQCTLVVLHDRQIARCRRPWQSC